MTLQPSIPDLLAAWMPAQRWYPAKGRGVGLRRLGELRLPDAAGEVGIEVHVVGLDSGDRLDVVQVPLTYRGAPLEGAEHALVGTAEHSELGTRWVYDGPHDPAYVAALLAALDHPEGTRVPVPSRTRVLSGEQSNTSVIVESDGADPLIVKVFRPLHPGANPDVEVVRGLAGSDQVPAVVGWLDGSWRTGAADDAPTVTGHLAVATEFVADGRDAWREAVEAVQAGRDYSAEAFGLGEATARMHAALAEAFGTVAASPQARTDAETALRDRIGWALRSTDALARHRDALAARAASLSLPEVPDLQRMHGDYHLGQVLHSPRRGWVVLDFEGEPLRPLSERTRPDLALRDVAGMLRSFDYAAGQVQVTTDDPARADAAGRWAEAARDAFCRGYAAVAGTDPRDHGALLGALELDKALYEVVYEAGNRPDWIDVPLHAVDRLLSADRS